MVVRLRDVMEAEAGVMAWPALKVNEGAQSQARQAASSSWRQGNTFPLESLGLQPCRHLTFSPLRPILDIRPPEL